ncbi:uncharacterized protein LOC114192728 [Vigna unguiculata]|uniref:uncharacterized protein LOC114192728 n=1 Tax=Vigna unguiculata TaxID=3917 RepID=UPI0010168199|nr:uncharacterized protein LOC114192728 [Vigna unguiculata]
MWISISIRVSFLVLFAVCLNLQSWISAYSDSNSYVDINIIRLSIENDLPPASPELLLFADFERKPVEIRPGNRNAYLKFLNMENHSAVFKWKQCATFSVKPATEEGHQSIYWSVRADGLYHSWDNSNWDKREQWGSC